uniref:TM2 domain containing 1 n=1 Tax=Capra hircus TaxID=9925 RepID=A0A8C2N8V2_CAPHI
SGGGAGGSPELAGGQVRRQPSLTWAEVRSPGRPRLTWQALPSLLPSPAGAGRRGGAGGAGGRVWGCWRPTPGVAPGRWASLLSAVQCFPAPNIICKDFGGNETHFTGSEVGFFKPISCRNVNGYSYKVAVALSLFLGWLGADRFYLGYPALGLLKFCTVGFCGIGSLIDFILISMQIVGPSDGSSYIIDYYGTRLTRLSITNETFRKTQSYP